MSYNVKERWKEGGLSLGWTAIPTVLFFVQNDKKLSPLTFNTLLNLIVHWWDVQEWPHPSMESLAIRMGVSVRSVQRSINELEKANLLDKKPTFKNDRKYGGRNIYDLTKLVDYLNTMGPSVALQVRSSKKKNVQYTFKVVKSQEIERRGVLENPEYINISEDYELNYILHKLNKKQTNDNRSKLRVIGEELKIALNKPYITHSQFYDYIEKNQHVLE